MPLQEARFSMLWFGASPPHSTPPCAHRAGAAALQEAKRHHLLGNWTCGPAAMATLPNLVPACLPGPMAAVANRTTRAFFALWAPCCRRDKPAVTRRGQAIVLELLQALTSQQGTESKDWLFSRQDITGYHIIARKRLQQISQFSGC